MFQGFERPHSKGTGREEENRRRMRSSCAFGVNWLVQRAPSSRSITRRNATVALVVFFLVISLCSLTFLDWFQSRGIFWQNFISSIITRTSQNFPPKCTSRNLSPPCQKHHPNNHNQSVSNLDPSPSNLTCPSYFRWIHEDLRPWKDTGITRNMIERAQKTAHFRLVIMDGKAYVKKYRQAIQTRDLFTLWGILQLLRWYPGRLPDLELLFDCKDRPVVRSKDYRGPKTGPPPLFRYCGDDESLDIVFPDWSFWGWAETNIRPWNSVLKNIEEGNKRTIWKDRTPYAFWRGNPYVTPTRKDLMKCNVSSESDWNTRFYIQEWEEEARQGYKQSHLEDQCTHRYKVYVEGWAWSVSEKYILACDSMTLYVSSKFYTFYKRGMEPLKHYWPIRDTSKCMSLKFAVEWGNSHAERAQGIGEAASRYIQEDLKMERVYDYMFHLLNEYAKLLKTKPTIPSGAIELCPETMACLVSDTINGIKFFKESMVMSPSDTSPCALPPPYDRPALRELEDGKAKSVGQVEMWENENWRDRGNVRK